MVHLTEFEKRELLQALSSSSILRRLPPDMRNRLFTDMLRDRIKECTEKKYVPMWAVKSLLPVLELHIEMVKQLQLQAREDGQGLDVPSLYSALEHAYKLRVRKLRELKAKLSN